MFRLVERPTLMPAKTLIGSTVGPVVDTETILPNGGRVYLSEIEVGECARFFPAVVEKLAADLGWVSPDACTALRDRVSDLSAELEKARSGQPKVVSLEDALKLAETVAA